jgi:hypothetical protein
VHQGQHADDNASRDNGRDDRRTQVELFEHAKALIVRGDRTKVRLVDSAGESAQPGLGYASCPVGVTHPGCQRLDDSMQRDLVVAVAVAKQGQGQPFAHLRVADTSLGQ